MANSASTRTERPGLKQFSVCKAAHLKNNIEKDECLKGGQEPSTDDITWTNTTFTLITMKWCYVRLLALHVLIPSLQYHCASRVLKGPSTTGLTTRYKGLQKGEWLGYTQGFFTGTLCTASIMTSGSQPNLPSKGFSMTSSSPSPPQSHTHNMHRLLNTRNVIMLPWSLLNPKDGVTPISLNRAWFFSHQTSVSVRLHREDFSSSE